VAGRGRRGRTAEERIRVGDLERERVVRRLCAAVGEGRLTLAEAGDRQAAAYAARFRGDLAALLVDLPAEAPDAGRPDAGLPGGSRLRDALRTMIAINGIALCLGLSTVPGAAALAALLSGIAIMLVVTAAEGIGGLRGTQRTRSRPRPPCSRVPHDVDTPDLS
jgi:hypothetical protein